MSLAVLRDTIMQLLTGTGLQLTDWVARDAVSVPGYQHCGKRKDLLIPVFLQEYKMFQL